MALRSDNQRSKFKDRSNIASKIDGFKLTIDALRAKLASLGGDSETEKAMLEGEVSKAQEKQLALEQEKQIKDICEQADDCRPNEKGGASMTFSGAEDMAHTIANYYRSLGCECRISVNKNVFDVEVNPPKALEGKGNLLEMSADDIKNAGKAPGTSPSPQEALLVKSCDRGISQ